MNKKWYLVLSVVQLALGFLITLSFVVLAIWGYEEIKSYISTFIIGLFFFGMGIYSSVKWVKGNKNDRK